MKIKNDSVRIQIGNKKYDFHNLILNEYIKRLINKQLSKEVATNSDLTKSTKLTYLLLKLDTPINNINQDSVLTNYDFDITIVHRASIKQDISEKQVVIQYDYSILVNDYVIDLKTAQLGKDSSETIKQLADFYDRKITAIGFTTHWFPYKEVPVCAVLDTSNYSIFLERNQDLTISRKDIITTDAEFSTNNKEKVKGPAHLSPLGLPQIIYQPSIVQTLKDDEGNDYIKKHEFYDYAKGVLTSVGLSQNPNYIEKEYKIGEDIQAVNNETEIEINGIINDEKEEGNVYPSDELFPIEPRTLPIQSSKGIKETSIKTNEENDFFVNIDGKSTQDTRDGKNKFDLDYIRDSSALIKTDTGVNLIKVWVGDVFTTENVLKTFKPNTTYTMKAKAKVVSRPTTIVAHELSSFSLYRQNSSELGFVWVSVLNMPDKETIALNTEKEYITSFTTPADMTDVRFISYTFYGNNDGSTTGSAQGEIDVSEIMLVEGTYTAENFPDFELYGVSPSPDYPSEIKSIGDDINLINDADIINGSLSSGNIVSGYGYRLVTNNPIQIKSSTDCNINFRNIGEFKGVRVGIHSYDAEGNFISDSGWVSFTNLQATIKTGANWKSVRFVFSFQRHQLL